MISNIQKEELLKQLASCYEHAETSQEEQLCHSLTPEEAEIVRRCGNTKHAARGAAITFGITKLIYPNQDIRLHKAEMANGYSARRIDTLVTVPFLQSKGLPYNVETHWLSQTLSFAGPFMPDMKLTTVPKSAGKDLIYIANIIQAAQTDEKVKSVISLLLYYMIKERNMGKIPLTRPKNLSIDQVMTLLHAHFSHKYERNAPRLPQIAIYALYQCLKTNISRYADFELMPLERLKTANRKSGSVADIDLHFQGRPIEAVEIKYEIPINASIVSEAIQKIKSESVERYLILSTKTSVEEPDEINRLKESFLRSNGCEIIVNGVYETIKYYLRLLKSTTDFINKYTDNLTGDPDLDYEHRTAWNIVCDEIRR